MAEVSIKIGTDVESVWDALTRPDLIKSWLFGTDTETDWQTGSPIFWRGVWEGKSYEDKGTVLEVQKPNRLVYTHWSSFSGKPECPENYVTVTCNLQKQSPGTLLTVSQSCSEDEREKCETSWKAVLESLAKLLTN
ncbi:MAG TPA: SRPBCC family protein [Oculatellaceae cyanobacterium]